MTLPTATTLSVEAHGGTLHLRLEVPERDLGEPIQRLFRHALDPGALAALVAGAEELLRGPERADFAAAARARGELLYRALVPQALRAELRAVTGPLVVSTTLPGLPWELLHDGDEFWGLRYAIGRRLVLERAIRTAARGRRDARPRVLVLGADPRGDLPFVAREVELVCASLSRVADVDAVAGRLATFDAVVAALGRPYDVVHWCGHVVVEGGESALLLAGEQRLPGTLVEAGLGARPLVFLNGCASAHQTAATAPSTEAALASMAHAFLLGGALAVVGTIADVGDRHAATLAEAFYRGALARQPLGEALRAARAALCVDPDGARSPAWLSVVLYGNPARALPGAPSAADAPLPEAALATGQPTPAGVVAVPTPVVLAAEAPREPAVRPATPLPAAAARRRLRRRLVALAAVVLLAVVVAAAVRSRLTPTPGRPVVVGVMAVRARGGEVPEWMRELTRDGLNTVLSRVPQVRVYSRQKIDFLRERRDLSEIEAAEALGMSKMLSATVGREGGQVTLGLEVVDIESGMLEATAQVQGPEASLIELQTELALRALDALGVHPGADELKSILASRASETLDAYRLLAETLGEVPSGSTPGPRPGPAPAPPAPAPAGPGSSWLQLGTTAWAQAPDRDEVAIRELLAHYAAALESKSTERLAALQVEMSPAQRASLERYFAIASGLHVRISDVDVLVDGPEAVAGFTREDVFVDAPSGRSMRLVVRVSGLLTKGPEGWRIRRLREPS